MSPVGIAVPWFHSQTVHRCNAGLVRQWWRTRPAHYSASAVKSRLSLGMDVPGHAIGPATFAS